eukprot:1160947-Pelagomonas_calceolata.AAC.14
MACGSSKYRLRSYFLLSCSWHAQYSQHVSTIKQAPTSCVQTAPIVNTSKTNTYTNIEGVTWVIR